MKVTSLQVENYQRITLARIDLDPDAAGVVALMGKNEAGKSSMLDAFHALVAGRNAPKKAQPIHAGADRAEIIAEFRDDDGSHIVVTRRYTAKGTDIVVRQNDIRQAKPDAILARLYSHVALDPLAFANLKPKEQVDTIVRLTGFDPTPLDQERDNLFVTRTEANSRVKALEAQLDAHPAHDPQLLGAPLVSAAALSLQLGNTAELQRRYDALASSSRRAHDEVDAAARTVSDAEHALRSAQGALDAAHMRKRDAELEHAAAELAAANAAKELQPKIAEAEQLRIEIAQADERNAAIRAQEARAATAGMLDTARARADELTKQIAELEQEKRDGFAAANMPVPGLTIEGEQILLDGTPFSQASAGRKLRTSTAIAMRLNPTLRAIVIRDGSLLDQDNRRMIDELAREHDYTVLMEIVDENAPTGVVFEDGRTIEPKRADA